MGVSRASSRRDEEQSELIGHNLGSNVGIPEGQYGLWGPRSLTSGPQGLGVVW